MFFDDTNMGGSSVSDIVTDDDKDEKEIKDAGSDDTSDDM